MVPAASYVYQVFANEAAFQCVMLDALGDHDMSIGPTTDGGYYLIGLRSAHRGVFENIDWSTARVYAQTLARALDLGLRVRAVREWYDVDQPSDLERLGAELRALPPHVARHTRAVFERLGRTSAIYGTNTVGERPVRSA